MSADVGRAVNLSGPSIGNSAGEPDADAGEGNDDVDDDELDAHDTTADAPAKSKTTFDNFNNGSEDIT